MFRRSALALASLVGLLSCDRLTHPVAAPRLDRAPAARDLHRVLVAADVHFDPFTDRALARRLADAPVEAWPALLAPQAALRPSLYGSDANAALWISTLRAMRAADPEAEVVVVPGDLLAHEFPQKYRATLGAAPRAAFDAFVLKTSIYLARSLHDAFPRAQLLPAIGNNDGDCGDYAIGPRTPYLAAMARAWEPYVDRDGLAPTFAATYAQSGSYEARLPFAHARVVVPDTVFWSRRYGDECVPSDPRPGDAELRRFRTVTARIPAGEPTWIVSHIPPGIDVVYTFLRFGAPVPFLRPEAQAAYLAAIAGTRAHVSAMITGHLHQTGFRYTGGAAGPGVPILVAPSISPVFGNAPAFLDLAVSGRDATIRDYRAFELADFVGLRAHPHWTHAYSFGAAYGEPAFTLAALRDLHARESGSRALRSLLAEHAVSDGVARVLARTDWRAIRCAESALTAPDYLACREPQTAATSRGASPRTTPITSSPP